MPGLNGTGPQGEGKLTGRALGNCPEANVENSRPYGFGLGRRGCGGRFFLRNRMQSRGRGIWNVGSATDEVQALKKRIADLEAKLEEDNK